MDAPTVTSDAEEPSAQGHMFASPIDDPPTTTAVATVRYGSSTARGYATGWQRSPDLLHRARAEAIERLLASMINDPRAHVASLGDHASDMVEGLVHRSDAVATATGLTTAEEVWDEPLVWVPVKSRNGERWAPAQRVHSRKGDEDTFLLTSPSTSGSALGRDEASAIAAARAEIIERAAFMGAMAHASSGVPLDLSDDRSAMWDRYRLRCRRGLLATVDDLLVVMASVIDLVEERVTVGLGTGRKLPEAAEQAVLEALQVRSFLRFERTHLGDPYWFRHHDWSTPGSVDRFEATFRPLAAPLDLRGITMSDRPHHWATYDGAHIGQSWSNRDWHYARALSPAMLPVEFHEGLERVRLGTALHGARHPFL